MNTNEKASEIIQKWYGIEAIGPKENDELSYLSYACLYPITTIKQLEDKEINLVKCSIYAAFQMGRRFPYTGPNWIVQEEQPT